MCIDCVCVCVCVHACVCVCVSMSAHTCLYLQKHTALRMFITVYQAVDKEENDKEGPQTSEHGVDLDESLQDELCKLWDMSMNPVSTTEQ